MIDPTGVLARALSVPIAELKNRPLRPLKVAVIDSGIDATHPDLKGRVESSVLAKTDHDGNVTFDDLDPTANNDTYGHATAVASLIAGIAPHVTFIDIRVLGNNNYGSEEALLAGIDRGNRSDAVLLSVSVAVGTAWMPKLIPLTDYAYRRNKVIVAATRNFPLEDEGYPASVVACIGVGNRGRGAFDSWRYQRDVIEFMANGTDVNVAAVGGGYTTKTGTSFATPIVSGLVALLLGAYPELTPFEIKAVLKAFADEVRQPRIGP